MLRFLVVNGNDNGSTSSAFFQFGGQGLQRGQRRIQKQAGSLQLLQTERLRHPLACQQISEPLTKEPLSFTLMKLPNGSLPLLFDTQRDTFFSTSMANTTASTSSPFVFAYSFFAGFSPRQVRQVNQTVDTARQTYEYAEVSDRFNCAGDFVAFVVVGGKLFPRG